MSCQCLKFHHNQTSPSEGKETLEYQFTFDFGPSWYWMPDLFDKIYDRFGGRKASEFYHRQLLDPAYRVFYKDTNVSSSSKGKVKKQREYL